MAAKTLNSTKGALNVGSGSPESGKTGGGGARPHQPPKSSTATTTTRMSNMWKFRRPSALSPYLRCLGPVFLYAIVCLWWEELRNSWLTSSMVFKETEQEQRQAMTIRRTTPSSSAITTTNLPIIDLNFSGSSYSSTIASESNASIRTMVPFDEANFDTTREFCVEWQIDTDDWWTHRPDWIVTAENATHYCFGPIVETEKDRGKAQFFRDLYRNQFLNNCSDLQTRIMVNQGWGSDMRGVFEGLAYGMEQGRPVQFFLWDQSPWLYTVGPQAVINGTRQFINEQAAQQPPACPAKNMECYFLPLCGCPVGKVQKSHEPAKVNLDSPIGGWYLEYSTRTRTFIRHRMYQFLVERGPVMRTPCTVIHVRRADVVINPYGNETRRYHPMEDYITAARRGTSLVPTGAPLHENILLMTDDKNAISEAEYKYPQYRWMYINRTRHRGAEGGFENQIPSGDPVEEVVALLAEISLVRQCTSIVHTFSSLPYYLRAIMQSTHGWDGVAKLDIDDEHHATGGVWKAGNANSSLNVSRAYG